MISKKVYSLYQLSKSIQNVLKGYASQSYWVKAEILKLNYYEQSGHAYPDLVDKPKDKIKAQFRGTIWSTHFEYINNKFKQIGEALKDDMLVVIKVSVNYHSIYGLTLNILDVDTDYTLGELARQKQESIKRLKAEHLFDKNRTTTLPLLPKTIAVISVNSSKGYKDFVEVLEDNPNRFHFHCKLFPAILQGDRAVKTISEQLKRIGEYHTVFDAVVIIRGGGDEVGFSAYDNYELAKSIARCPIPVLTGIGHSTNLTVCEMVSFKSFITPTKLAEFLVECFEIFNQTLLDLNNNLKSLTNVYVKQHKQELSSMAKLFQSQSKNTLKYSKNEIEQLQNAVYKCAKSLLSVKSSNLDYFTLSINAMFKDFMTSEKQIIENFSNDIEKVIRRRLDNENRLLKVQTGKLIRQTKYQFKIKESALEVYYHRLRLQDPKHILKRGFSLTKINGSLIKATDQLQKGDIIETQYFKGKTESEIKIIKK